MDNTLNRRAFLRLGAVAGLASGVSMPTMTRASASSGPLHYKPLGRTGLRIADISFGASRLREGQEDLVRHALARGVNYFDTADSYTRGESERVIGKALKGFRDDVVIATKTAVAAGESSVSIMRKLEASLKALRIDYVDVYFNHAVNDIERVSNPEWQVFADKAREQGKIRFTGMSGHGGYLVDCVNHAVEHSLYDVMLLAHNFGQDPAFYEQFTRSFDFVAKQPELPAAMARAHDKGIGIIAMKVLRGAKLNDMRPFESDGYTYAQAAFKWVLGMPATDAAIISMTSRELIDEYLGASGQTKVTAQDFRLLEQYARITDLTYCRHACNDCEGACPFGVPIADTLRTRMYAVDYGDPEFARDEYQALATDASACLSCDGEPCRNACTHGIDIARLCGPTHVMLS